MNQPGKDYARLLRAPVIGRGLEWQAVPPYMNQKELKELIEFLIEKDIAEFELERGDVKVKIKRAGEHTSVHMHGDPRYYAVPAAPPAAHELGGVPVAAAPAAAPRLPLPKKDFTW